MIRSTSPFNPRMNRQRVTDLCYVDAEIPSTMIASAEGLYGYALNKLASLISLIPPLPTVKRDIAL